MMMLFSDIYTSTRNVVEDTIECRIDYIVDLNAVVNVYHVDSVVFDTVFDIVNHGLGNHVRGVVETTIMLSAILCMQL